jgi:L-lactate dehydrogenase (cytochrome)
MLALGAKGVLLGRLYIYALATGGESAVCNLLDLIAKEMRAVMALVSVRSIGEIDRNCLT